MLRLFQDCDYMRQLVDEIKDPPSLVLEHMDGNVLELENYRRFPLSAASPIVRQEDVEFFSFIMKIDPRQRPSASEILQHPGFNDV